MLRNSLVAAALSTVVGASLTFEDYESMLQQHAIELNAEEKIFHYKKYTTAIAGKTLLASNGSAATFMDTLPAMTAAKASEIAKVATFKVNPKSFNTVTVAEMQKKLGVIMTPKEIRDTVYVPLSKSAHEDSFTAIEQWPECASVIGFARDQGNCGSCWAMATVAAFNDRYCIASEGKFTNLFSTNHMLACSMRSGCGGGQMGTAWGYLRTRGIPTGNEHEDVATGASCEPYHFHKCAHHMPASFDKLPSCSVSDVHSDDDNYTPPCPKACTDSLYPKKLQDDLYKISNYSNYYNTDAVKAALKQGPLTASFAVYEDFLAYESGIYSPTNRRLAGYHAIKVIGWGIENGVEFWEAVNSWNENWGENGGRFRVSIKNGGFSGFQGGAPIIRAEDRVQEIRI